MTEPMHAYSHMKSLYENHMYVYKSVCIQGKVSACQMLYIATVGAHLESYHLVEEFGMSCARVIAIPNLLYC